MLTAPSLRPFCDLGMPPELGNAFFMIARLPGLVAHVLGRKDQNASYAQVQPVSI